MQWIVCSGLFAQGRVISGRYGNQNGELVRTEEGHLRTDRLTSMAANGHLDVDRFAGPGLAIRRAELDVELAGDC